MRLHVSALLVMASRLSACIDPVVSWVLKVSIHSKDGGHILTKMFEGRKRGSPCVHCALIDAMHCALIDAI